MIIQILMLPMHFFWCEFFFTYLDWGFISAGYASNMTDILAVAALCILVKVKSKDDPEIKEAWNVPMDK